MDDKYIERAFEEGQAVRSLLYKLQGENYKKTVEKFSYKFLEGLRRQDSGELVFNLIRLYNNFENREIPGFFKELLKDIGSMNQIGYAFLLGLNSYKESSEKSTSTEVIEEFEEQKSFGEEV